MSVAEISAVSTTPAKRAQLTRTSGYKISAAAAEPVEKLLARRVMWLRLTSATLMFAALVAIFGGIALIFYAGELATQQRSADVDILLQSDERLRAQRQQLVDELEKARERVSRGQEMLPYYQRQKESAEKEFAATPKDSTQYQEKKDAVDRANGTIERTERDLQAANSTLTETEKGTTEKIADIEHQRKNLNQKITGSGSVIEYNSIIIRIAAVLLIMFLVQTFITIFRYTMRIGAYYQARVDALRLAHGSDITIADLHKITSILSPESYDFGKVTRTPTEQALDFAKDIIRSQRQRASQ
jgi:hypothetical protein